MKVIIAGPRDLSARPHAISRAFRNSRFDTTDLEIISGGATGIDTSAIEFARDFRLPYRVVAADWDQYAESAGPIRNRQMAEVADALLVIKRKNEETRGTSSMMREARKRGLPIHVEEVGA